MTGYIVRVNVENNGGAAEVSRIDTLPINGKSDRIKTIAGEESIRMWFCSRVAWVIDLSHVGYSLMYLLKTKDRAPSAVINEKGTIVSLRAYGSTEIRNASAIVPGEGDLLKVRSIFRELGIGNSKKDPYTIASLARDLLYKSLGSYADVVDGSALSVKDYKVCKAAYRGGYHYDRPGHYEGGECYDINSLYPWVMVSKDMPIGAPTKNASEVRNPYGFYKICGNFYPLPDGVDCIPGVFKLYDKRPDGSYHLPPVWITKTDYKILSENYLVEDMRFLDCLFFETAPGADIFGTFISKWYSAKAACKGPKKTAAKLILNSASGSLGRSDVVYSREPYISGYDIKYKYTMREDPSKRLSGYMPIAAAITAYGRERIISDIKKVGSQNVIYSNTDSIFTTRGAGCILGTSKELGAYKMEFAFTSGNIYGHTSYILTDGEKIKSAIPGLSKADRKALKPEDVDRMKPGTKLKSSRWVTVDRGKLRKEVNITLGGE